MEKAILKTLIYADLFDYPLKIQEIHKWLIAKKGTLRQVEKGLKGLNQKSKIKNQNGYYFLPQKIGLVAKRIRTKKQSLIYFKKAKVLSQILKVVPWIKLVGISGGLAMENVSKKDDIDLFIITAKNRLWIARLLALGLLSLTGQRRKRTDFSKKAAGKCCVNILLEEDQLNQKHKDLFTAHEVLQMRVLWQRDGVYSKYLENNSWVFKFLSNWIDQSVVSSKYNVVREKQKNTHTTSYILPTTILDIFEKLAKKFQLKIMQKPNGSERIEDGALYFHPEDCRLKVLTEYKKKLTSI